MRSFAFRGGFAPRGLVAPGLGGAWLKPQAGHGAGFLTHQNESRRFVSEVELFKQRKAGAWFLFLASLLA